MKITNTKFPQFQLASEEHRGENFALDLIWSSLLALSVLLITYQNLFLAVGIFYLVRFCYYLLLEYFLGQTLGKLQTQSTVVNRQGSRPSLRQLCLRNLLRFISLFSAVSDNERAIHDYYSDTFVIHSSTVSKHNIKTWTALLATLLINGYFFYYVYQKPNKQHYDLFLLLLLAVIPVTTFIQLIRKRRKNRK